MENAGGARLWTVLARVVEMKIKSIGEYVEMRGSILVKSAVRSSIPTWLALKTQAEQSVEP